MHSCCCLTGLGLGLNMLVLFPSLPVASISNKQTTAENYRCRSFALFELPGPSSSARLVWRVVCPVSCQLCRYHSDAAAPNLRIHSATSQHNNQGENGPRRTVKVYLCLRRGITESRLTRRWFVRNPWFPPFRCRSAIAVSPLPLRKFRKNSVTPLRIRLCCLREKNPLRRCRSSCRCAVTAVPYSK